MTSILKADTIQDTDGNKIINESGNTITIGASGETTNIIGTLQNNGAAVGETMTPAFEAQLSSSQAISNTTYTKVQFDTEVFDSDGTYDNSTNYRFTPGVVGKYYIFTQVCLDDVNDGKFFDIYLAKNGSRTKLSRLYSGVTNKQSSVFIYIDNATSTSDYYEIEIYQDTGHTRNLRSDIGSYFGAFRITGA